MVNRFHRDADRKKRREKRHETSERERGEGRNGKLEGGGNRDRSICEMLIDRLWPFTRCYNPPFTLLGDSDRGTERQFFENASRRITLIRFGLQISPFSTASFASLTSSSYDTHIGKMKVTTERTG